jgi:hypothetical protein
MSLPELTDLVVQVGFDLAAEELEDLVALDVLDLGHVRLAFR